MNHEYSIINICNNIKSRQAVQETFAELLRVINGANYYADINVLNDEVVFPVLVEYLREGIMMKETLEVIACLL